MGWIQIIAFNSHNNSLTGMPYLHPFFQKKVLRPGETKWWGVHSLLPEETILPYTSQLKDYIHIYHVCAQPWTRYSRWQTEDIASAFHTFTQSRCRGVLMAHDQTTVWKRHRKKQPKLKASWLRLERLVFLVQSTHFNTWQKSINTAEDIQLLNLLIWLIRGGTEATGKAEFDSDPLGLTWLFLRVGTTC